MKLIYYVLLAIGYVLNMYLTITNRRLNPSAEDRIRGINSKAIYYVIITLIYLLVAILLTIVEV